MAKPQYKLTENSLQWQFQRSRMKIQIFGGGFGNGKTTSGVIKALQLATAYPGSNGLVARSTYPKLNDTVRKELLKWCPDEWIARKNLSQDNVVELTNGSVINFRYISQQGKSAESSTSNLLSATYDWILVDQIEDPEISEKDFLDLMGRLRGNASLDPDIDVEGLFGPDPMPSSGPRWFIVLCNPTRNWVYRKLVKPLHDLKNGIRNPDLIVDADTGQPIVELFEGSTYSNADNLPEDFIKGLESTYKGQMRERFLMGQWGAFEGLVYPQYDQGVHMLSNETIFRYLEQLINDGFEPKWLEAYDHGIAKQAAYCLSFVDFAGNVFVIDGFYEKEKTIEQLVELMHKTRMRLHNVVGGFHDLDPILADPSVFRRVSGNVKTVGNSVAGLFNELGLDMQRANNDIISGIAKVQSYLAIDNGHRHPILGTFGSPRLFFSNELTWLDQEFVDYYWKKDTQGEYEDIPRDKNDHGMDMLKYLLSVRPRVALHKPIMPPVKAKYMRWREYESQSKTASGRNARYGN